MAEHQDDLRIAWWENNLEELDREVARLALLCGVNLLDAGVIERVLHRDALVCGTANPVAFARLHDMLMVHFELRKRAVEALGEVQTQQIIRHIVDRLKTIFGNTA